MKTSSKLILFLSFLSTGIAANAQTVKKESKPDTVKVLKEVTIRSKQPVILEKADRTIVDVERMNTTGDNALEVLQRSPGIHLDKDENIVMKGRSGVNVMIDGKMSYMTGAELTAYLKSIPASAMSKIELMSSPPSSFDAAGSAGVINIKLRRNRMEGLNGNTSSTFTYGKYEKAYAGLSLNYNRNKLSTYIRLNGGYSNSFNRLTLKRIIDGNRFDQVNLWRPKTTSLLFTTGADYFLNERHTFGIMVRGETAPYTTNSSSNSVSYDAADIVTAKVNSKNPQKNTGANYAYNLNYRFKIDSTGKELGIDADYVTYHNTKDEHFSNTYTDQNDQLLGSPVQLRNRGTGEVKIYALKLDYSHPFSKTLKAETGVKSSWVNTDNDVRFDSLKTEGWRNAANRTNRFVYHEHINAAYISLTQSFKQLELQGGLRAEQTLGDGTSSATSVLIDRKYWQLFPTLFATWKIDSSNVLNAKFARRINRPSYTSLNPFTLYSDPYTAIQGNPLLMPSFANNVELTYSYKEFRVISLNYSKTKGLISTVMYQNDLTKESISTPQNLSNGTNIYIATGSPFNVTKWWNTNNEAAVSYDEISSPVQGTAYNNSKWSWSASTENTFTLPKDYQVSLSAFYYSPSIMGLYNTLANYQISLGARKTLMNKKATLSFKANDIFNTAKFRANLLYNNVNTYWQNQWESRKFSLSFSYKFGNTKIKTARNRSTGTEEEQGRVSH